MSEEPGAPAETPPASPAEAEAEAGEGEAPETPNAEAARYRRRLRAAEADREALRGRLELMQRSAAEHVAGDVLADPTDLWLFGQGELGELLDEHGELDPVRVRAAAAAIVATRPGLSRTQPGGAAMGQGRRPAEPQAASWAQLLRGG